MSESPYRIEGPALISFSGGRTSAYMLHEIVKAHGGVLPDDVVVAFANTGKEREETLRFVHECGTRWGVNIAWLEWRDTEAGFERVGFNSASRQGEPFAALIAKRKGRLPNWHQRWCTGDLKVATMYAFMRSLGIAQWSSIIGLRDDEGHRILKGLENAEKRGDRVAYPLAKAKVRKADVMAFWAAQPFDLGLKPHEGNCDLCFLKGRRLRKAIIRDNPRAADWWTAQEVNGQWFDKRDRLADLVAEVRKAPDMFAVDDDEYDAECGDACGLEAAA